jgi:hypothetical protein
MDEINNIKIAAYNKIKEYLSHKKDIEGEEKLYTDLSIYGDDFEDIIHKLANIFKFDENNFWKIFIEKGYYSPGEINMKLPKIFYIDIGKLLKCKIVYQTIDSKGKDITVDELIQLLQEVTKK